ncbi:MAG: GTP-binding protein, partial [Promethearchaeota archaeon]
RRDALLDAISNIPDYFKTIASNLMAEKTFKQYKMGYSDTPKFRLLHILVDDETILTVFLRLRASFDNIIPYALFLTEKITQIFGSELGELTKISLPSFQYEENIFNKYKAQMQQMGFDVGGIYRFKFAIVGDNAVGKTAVVRTFVENEFSKDYRATIGLNIITHNFEFHGNDINIVIWDVGGQSNFERYRKTYYLGTQAAFIVFDLTNRKSFENVEKWYSELKANINKPDVPIILVGNKSDLINQRVVTFDEGLKMADKLSSKELAYISYIETSALNGDNVQEAFKTISYLYMLKTKEIEEKREKDQVLEIIQEILEENKTLTLAFYTESPFWSPGLKVMTGIEQLGEFKVEQGEKGIIEYIYENGLILKNCIRTIQNLADFDGILCVFDAIHKKFDPAWRDLLTTIIKTTDPDRAISVGIRVPDDQVYIHVLEQLSVKELEERLESILIFKLAEEIQLDIYEQLKNILNRIKHK